MFRNTEPIYVCQTREIMLLDTEPIYVKPVKLSFSIPSPFMSNLKSYASQYRAHSCQTCKIMLFDTELCQTRKVMLIDTKPIYVKTVKLCFPIPSPFMSNP